MVKENTLTVARSCEDTLPPVPLDFQDTPTGQALEQLFNSVNVQFSIDNSVSGFVTIKASDQPFDTALKVLLRSASVPLSCTCTSGVYIVKSRVIADSNSQPVNADDTDKN